MKLTVRFLQVILPLVVLSVGARSAGAALVSVDLNPFTGDGLITRDTATSLEWLDVTETKGFSINEILAGAQPHPGDPFEPSWIELGFQPATLAEICGLFTPRTGAIPGCGGSNSTVSDAAVLELQSFLGITHEEPYSGETIRTTEGFFASGFAGLGRLTDGTSAIAQINTSGFDPSRKDPDFGNYLVRVPEPDLAVCFALLAAILILTRASSSAARRLPRVQAAGRAHSAQAMWAWVPVPAAKRYVESGRIKKMIRELRDGDAFANRRLRVLTSGSSRAPSSSAGVGSSRCVPE